MFFRSIALLALATLTTATTVSAEVKKAAVKPAATKAVAAKPMANPKVKISTNMGVIVLELDAVKAPKSVENFLAYVKSGFYNNTVFHRIIPTFMVQGGGFTRDLTQKPTRSAIMNEADNGLMNMRGTVAMARTGDPHSATSQFFINVVDNAFLNFQSKETNWGYAVFGKVVAGMDVVDRIKAVETGGQGMFPTDVPKSPVVIEKAEVMK